MPNPEALESTDVFERFVLLAVAELTQEGTSPVVSYEVMDRCRERAADIDVISGGVERRKVMSALTRLTEAGLLAEEREQTNPSGKGRPEYTLELSVGELIEQLGTDDSLSAYASRLE